MRDVRSHRSAALEFSAARQSIAAFARRLLDFDQALGATGPWARDKHATGNANRSDVAPRAQSDLRPEPPAAIADCSIGAKTPVL
jgi:hypothetical protein